MAGMYTTAWDVHYCLGFTVHPSIEKLERNKALILKIQPCIENKSWGVAFDQSHNKVMQP